MRLDIIDIDKWAADLPEIKSPKIIEGRRFSKDGLFSQKIFGPIKSFHCGCTRSYYRGPSSTESSCNACGVEITTSDERRKRFGKIALPFEILNPIFYYLVTDSKISSKRIIDNLLSFKATYYMDEKKELHKIDPVSNIVPTENCTRLEGLSGAVFYINHLVSNKKTPEFEFIEKNMNLIKIKNIVVIPPDFRNCGKNTKGKYVADNINQFYSQIIISSNHIKNIPYMITESDELYKSNFRYIQSNVFKLYDYILERLSQKKGLVRSNILGKRMDFSGRAVISPDPTLELDQTSLPYVLVLEIFKPQLTAYLVNRKLCKRYNQGAAIIEECIKNNDTRLFSILEEFTKNKVCFINRQPTLHRTSILGFKIKINLGNTIRIHPLITGTMNGDFDGDAVAIYIPITKESTTDIEEKLLITKNLVSATDSSAVPEANQDIILGIYALTK